MMSSRLLPWYTRKLTPSSFTEAGLPTFLTFSSAYSGSATSTEIAGWGSACRTGSWFPGDTRTLTCFGIWAMSCAAREYCFFRFLSLSWYSCPGYTPIPSIRSPAITTYLTLLTMSRSPSLPFSHKMSL